ncbi:MAG: hypothetical protein GYA33_03860 [Thermogutta sp.]|nr:hypothetical protein [Thermogutta sp.]
MKTAVTGWDFEVGRVAGWLVIQCIPPDRRADRTPLARELCELIDRCLADRVVLELDRVESLSAFLINELLAVHRFVDGNGGLLRLSGLADKDRNLLERLGLGTILPAFHDLEEAVMGCFAPKPR